MSLLSLLLLLHMHGESHARVKFTGQYIEAGYRLTSFAIQGGDEGIGGTLQNPLVDAFRVSESFAGILVTPVWAKPWGYDISSGTFHGAYVRFGTPFVWNTTISFDLSGGFARSGGEALLWEADSNSLFAGNSATYEYTTTSYPFTYRLGLSWLIPGTRLALSGDVGAIVLITNVQQEWRDPSSSLAPADTLVSGWYMHQRPGASLGITWMTPLSPHIDFSPRVDAFFSDSDVSIFFSVGARRYF